MGIEYFTARPFPDFLTWSLLVEFQHLGLELIFVDLCSKNLNAKVFVIYPVLLVFISLVDHVLIDIEDAGLIDEPSIEPELECFLLLIEESDLNIIIY